MTLVLLWRLLSRLIQCRTGSCAKRTLYTCSWKAGCIKKTFLAHKVTLIQPDQWISIELGFRSVAASFLGILKLLYASYFWLETAKPGAGSDQENVLKNAPPTQTPRIEIWPESDPLKELSSNATYLILSFLFPLILCLCLSGIFACRAQCWDFWTFLSLLDHCYAYSRQGEGKWGSSTDFRFR